MLKLIQTSLIKSDNGKNYNQSKHVPKFPSGCNNFKNASNFFSVKLRLGFYTSKFPSATLL